MAVVLKTWKADGTLVMSPLSAGGVFVEKLKRVWADGNATITYQALNGMTLRVFQVYRGPFTWSVGTDGSGNPTITITRVAATVITAGQLTLLVFAV